MQRVDALSIMPRVVAFLMKVSFPAHYREGAVSIGGLILALLTVVMLACSEAPEPAATENPDIILVTIDTLRSDTLGYAGHPRVKTPFIDRLAREGRTFANAHAHNVVTLPSHTNILTGLLPYQHGVRDNAGFTLDPEYPTVAEMLGERGYATGAFVGAYPLDARFGLNEGFDVYDDRYREGSAPKQFVMAERPADEVIAAARAWWEGEQGKKFMWVHLYDPHAPYKAPERFAARHPNEPYLAEIEWVDDQLQSLLGPLVDSDQAPLVIFTSDHGEGLGEHGELTHGVFAYESTLRVPLIVREPGVIEPASDERYARHIDIVPTILERVGIEAEELPGGSLLSADQPRDTYFEALTASFNRGWAPLVGIIHDQHKYIDLPVPELYDLASDPDEKDNVVSDERRTLFRLRDLLAESAPVDEEVERGEVSQEEAQQLLSLGYVTGSHADREYTVEDDPKNLIHLDQKAQRIIALYQEGETDEAIELARSILAERSDMTLVREMMSFLLQEAERPEAAIASLREGLEQSPGDEAMQRRLGLVLSESGRAEEAVEILSRFEDTDDPELLNAYGIALADTGRLVDAVRQFERTLEVDETNATAYQNLGIAALRAGDLRRSHDYLMKALELNDQMPIALNTLGVVYARSGNTRGAIEAWKRSIALDPAQYDALFNLALTAGRSGEIETARKSLETFIETAPPERYDSDIATARALLARMEETGS